MLAIKYLRTYLLAYLFFFDCWSIGRAGNRTAAAVRSSARRRWSPPRRPSTIRATSASWQTSASASARSRWTTPSHNCARSSRRCLPTSWARSRRCGWRHATSTSCTRFCAATTTARHQYGPLPDRRRSTMPCFRPPPTVLTTHLASGASTGRGVRQLKAKSEHWTVVSVAAELPDHDQGASWSIMNSFYSPLNGSNI